jgi:FeS assembly SUF system protein
MNEEKKTEENKPEEKSETNEQSVKPVDPEVLKEEVIKVLRSCYDPEIPVNIYELGLIYDINIEANGDVLVMMTLTSPACPVAGTLPVEVQEKLKEHPMINNARVEITFDPPWSFDNMSEEAKLELGFL